MDRSSRMSGFWDRGMRGTVALGAGAAALALLLAGCASMRVDSYIGRDVDFASYRSFEWAASDRLSTGDPRLDNNPFFMERLKSAVEKHMADRGFEKRAAAPADLVVHYHASVSQRIDVNGIDQEFGVCESDDCDPFVYEAGTIVLDLVDARTNKLVWRGWARDSVEGVIDDQSWMEQKIDEAVARIMEKLPRSPLKARG